MVNYKQQFRDSITIAGYTHTLETGDKIKYLRSPQVAATETLHDLSTNANYQIPTGKRLKIIVAELLNAAVANDRLITSTVVDSTTGEVIIIEPFKVITIPFIFVTGWLAAELYITKVDSGASSQYDVIGIEADA